MCETERLNSDVQSDTNVFGKVRTPVVVNKCSRTGSATETTLGVASTSASDADRRPGRPAAKEIKSIVPKNRQDLIKWNGWGYKDSQFIVDPHTNVIQFTGSRYPIGDLRLPYFTEWVQKVFAANLQRKNEAQPLPAPDRYPDSRISPESLEALRAIGSTVSVEGIDRLVRAHGHTLHDIFVLRDSLFDRIPDVVVWPACHEHVVRIVRLAEEHNLVIIPFGGGTSVSGAVNCPVSEQRPIISLDTTQMNRMIHLDKENWVVCFEAGIIGQDLERELRQLGYTVGHEPDSYEFSSLGGWVATRASGMKKNVYGNIEDLLVHVRMVTPKGVLQKNCQAPRISCGPDFNHIVLGSEGTLGVITEVTIKIRPLPSCKKYGSLVFPDFEAGVKFMREVAKQRCQPASIRLMDNEQFHFGQSLRPEAGVFGLLLDGIKHMYLGRIKGFKPDQMCVTTLLFEGEKADVLTNKRKLYSIAKQFGGIPAGEKNGERGYCLTFVIAYIRDLGLDYSIVAESFETSVPWDRALSLCKNVKHRIASECVRHGIAHYMVCCRVTQTYDSGCCIYFYFAFNYEHLADPVGTYELIEERARDEIVASGGSISHHHGVGKLRKKWYADAVSTLGLGLYQATKAQLDPQNVFASGNLTQAKL